MEKVELTPLQLAEMLNCSEKTIRNMLRDGLIPGNKQKGKWYINETEIGTIISCLEVATTVLEQPQQELSLGDQEPNNIQSLQPDLGLVEVSMALAGIATAMAAFLPQIGSIPGTLKTILGFCSGILAVFSTYSALWLLSWYCLKKHTLLGIEEIGELLIRPEFGPYWLLSISLLIWLGLAALLAGLAILN